jgi:hypothetical protein
MDVEKIEQELNRRFAAPLSEFYKRRIIFWYDEDREFEERLEDLQLESATLVVLTGSNTFAVKKLLCEDDLSSNFLVYQPLSFNRDDENWLINVQIYSEEFRADINSIWMDEMGLPATPVIRKQVKNYRKFFNAKPRRDAVAKLNNNISTAAQMHLAVMAALLPHKNLDIVEKGTGALSILADGVSTDSGYRDKILKSANKNSVALKYDNIIGMKRDERSALVRGMDVVYLYHDKVDEASHTSDVAVFPACDDAIVEIKNLVRIIVNEFGGTKIYITADQ